MYFEEKESISGIRLHRYLEHSFSTFFMFFQDGQLT